MPELGTKFECIACGVKFYDLGKPEPVCPKCGTDQNSAQEEAAKAAETARIAPVPAAAPTAQQEAEPVVGDSEVAPLEDSAAVVLDGGGLEIEGEEDASGTSE